MEALPLVRAEILGMDADLALGRISTLDSMLTAMTGQSRFTTLLLSLFAGLSLLLAGVGIYGVMSYGVNNRTHEIGVRISLGASTSEIARQVVGQSLRLTLAGVTLGVLGTLFTTRLIAGLLFGIEGFDSGNLLLVTALCTGVAVLASYLPARRASRVDPMTAFRVD